MEKQKLIYVESKALFSPSEVSDKAIVFIKDTKEIWTHGVYFSCSGTWATPITLSLTGDTTGSVSIDGSGNASIATTTLRLSTSSYPTDANNAASTALHTISYYRVNRDASNLFPVGNNANAILSLNVHDYSYTHLLGFSSNGNIYHRRRSAGTWDTSWKTILNSSNYTNFPHTFASLTNKPTTLSGYGITDCIPIISGLITPDTDLGTLGMTTTGAKLSVNYTSDLGSPSWLYLYSNFLMFRSTADTYGGIATDTFHEYVTFIGGRNPETTANNVPNWWFRIKGASGTTYDLNSILNKINNLDSNYLRKSGGTMTGILTLTTGSAYINDTASGYSIYGSMEASNTSIGTSGLATIFSGAPTLNMVLRTSGDNLYHYNHAKSARYLILDTNNYSTYALPLSGGTMKGALNFANNTWNKVGDDAYMGDCNVAGMIGIKGSNANTPGFVMYNTAGTLLGKLYASGSDLYWSGVKLLTSTGSAKEAYLAWGGQNLRNNSSPIDTILAPVLGANRLAFISPDAITIEYSKDSGATWTNYNVSDSNKVLLFAGGKNYTRLYLGGDSTQDASIDRTSWRLRITISAIGYSLYCRFLKFMIYVTDYGNTLRCALLGRTYSNVQNDVDTWVTFLDTALGGWSGWNTINHPAGITIPHTAHYGQIRFDFYMTSLGTTGMASLIQKIMGFASACWTWPSNLAGYGNIYSYDWQLNVTFPAQVTATGGFSGNLTGNVTGDLIGNADTASNISTVNPILALPFEKNTIQIVSNPLGALAELLGTAAAITHALRFNWYNTAYEIGNVRGGASNSLGFGITYGNNNLCLLVKTNGTYSPYGFIGSLSGNASTASKWKTARTITLTGDVTGSVTLDGSSNVTLTTATSGSGTSTFLKCIDKRNSYPALIVTSGGNIGASFMSASKLGLSDGSYYDAIILRGYVDNSGGNENALLFSKNSSSVYHSQYAFGSTTTWGTMYKFLDSNNYSSYALPLSGGTLTGKLTLTTNTSWIADSATSAIILGTFASGNSSEGLSSEAGILIGSLSTLTTLRSNGDDLWHYRNSDKKRYKILDAANYTNYTINYAKSALTSAGSVGVIKDGKLYYNSALSFAKFVQSDNSGRYSYELIAELTNYGTGVNTSYITYGISGFMWAYREGNGANSCAYSITAIVNVGPAILRNMLRVSATTDVLIPFVVKYNDKYYIALRKNNSSTTFYFMGFKHNLLTTTIIVNDASLIEEIAGPITETSTASKFYNNGNPQPYLHSGNYYNYALPLYGGVLTGKLTMKANSIDNLPTINRTDAQNTAGIRFLNSLGYLGAIGMNTVNGCLYVLDASANLYPVLDSRNYNNYAAAKSHTHPWSDITSKPSLLGEMAKPIFFPYSFFDLKLGAYISTINNRFYSADLRYTVTTTNFASGSVHYLFDDNYDNRMQINMGTTATITIEGYNFVYNNGYIILSFYMYSAYPLLLPKTATVVATTQSGTTYTLNRATSVEAYGTMAFSIGLEYLTKLEITIVSLDNAYCGITNIDYFSRRTENTVRDCAVVTKYNANTLYHNLTAPKYIVSGGTSSQFLKADGSLDSSNYYKIGTELPIYRSVHVRDANTNAGIFGVVNSGSGLVGGTDLETVYAGENLLPFVLRTSSDNLYHYNNAKTTRYKILDSFNVNSYALPITGGTLTGKLTMKANSIDNLPLIYRTDAAYISGIRFLNTLGYLGAIGMNAVSGNLYILDTANTTYTILDSRNYNNYSPTLTGTGALGTWAINISGVAASASKVANALTIQLNGGTTVGTNKFVYDGSSAYTINITPAAIGASATSHTHNYLPLSGGTLGSSTASSTLLWLLSSTAKMRLMAYSDSTNYIQSGNSDFSGNATLKITGYNSNTGSNLYLNFANIYCRAGNYTNIDSGNYSTYALPLTGGTLTDTLVLKAGAFTASNGNSYSGGRYQAVAKPNIRLIGDSTYGLSTIEFISLKGDTTINKPSDSGFIQFQPYGVSALSSVGSHPTLKTSGETNALVLGVTNDADDIIVLQSPNVSGLRHACGTTEYYLPHVTTSTTTANKPLVSTTTAHVYTLGAECLPLSGGTMTGTINCEAIVPITDNGYSIGTSSKTLYEIHANFFKRRGSSNDYVLLGGGEHKLISDFVLNYTAVVPGGSVGNNDSWTLILNNNYSTGWYNPCTMFYIRSHNFGCGILCFYHYWDTSLTSGYYDNSVWFFGAEHSAYSGTMGGTGRDINNFLKVYIDKDNDNLKIYYNRYNNLSMEILELLFSLYLAGTLYPKGLIRASHFITNGAVTDLPITSNTFVNIPILTAKNHTEDIKTTRSVYASAFYENSDIRLKENVHSIDLIDLLKNVDLVQFNFKDSSTKKYGVIAQLLELVGLQNLVYENNGNKAVDYISLLVLEIQRLRNEIGELKLEINKKS